MKQNATNNAFRMFVNNTTNKTTNHGLWDNHPIYFIDISKNDMYTNLINLDKFYHMNNY